MRALPRTLSSRRSAALSNRSVRPRAGTALLLSLALLLGLVLGGTPAAAQPNTNGLAFTGDAVGEVPGHTAIDTLSSGLTVELWVKHTGTSDPDAVLVGNKADLFNDGFSMHLVGEGEDVRVAFRPGSDSSHHVRSTTPLEKGRWYHVAGTYRNTSTGSITTLYVNGDEDASTTNSGFESNLGTGNDLVFGSTVGGSSNFLRGGLDDVRIWGRALSKIAVNANFTSERDSTANGLVAYFKLNESSGSTFANAITSNDGTLTGSYALGAAGALPVAPADVHARPGDGQVTVSFDRPSYDSTSLSEYIVYRTKKGGSRQQVETVGASDSTVTDTNVQNNTLYFYEVAAVTSSGDTSDYSERAHATVTDQSGLRFSGGTVSFNKTASLENLESGTAIGLDFWVKYDEDSDENAVLLGNKDAVGAGGYTVQFVGTGKEVRIAFKPSDDPDRYVTSETPVEAGRWYHVTATHTATSSGTTTELFVNGKQEATATDGAFKSIGTTNPLVFGAKVGGGQVFRGALSEVRIWNTASIRPGELIDTSLVGDERGLVGYFRFDEPDGSSVVRSSARPLTGTLPSGVTLDTPGPRPAPPIAVRTQPVSGNVELHFRQPTYTRASISNYTIYRTREGNRTVVATTDTTVYTDANASDGTLYEYEVTANASDGRESDFSVQEPATTYPNRGGNALELSGTGSFVEFPQTPSLQNLERGNAIGIDFWVKHSGASDSSAVLIGNKNSFGSAGYVVHLVGEGQEARVAFKPSEDSDRYVTSETALEAGLWYHVTVTHTATSSGTMSTLFIDGEKEATASDDGFKSIDSGNPLVVGSTADGSSNFFQGSIDEVRLWSTAALTPSSLKDRSLIGNEEDLVGYWRFNEPSGSDVARSSARPLTGTISNGTFVTSNAYSPPPTISVSPLSLDFGRVEASADSTKTVTIAHEGTLSDDSATLRGNVSLEDGTGGLSIASGGGTFRLNSGSQQSVSVEFAPDSVGTIRDTVVIRHNADSTESPLAVPVVGVGKAAQLAGTVWYPAVTDGSFSVTGRALNGVTVRAVSASDTATTTTGINGNYAFSNVPDDAYTLSVAVEGDSGHVETGDAFRTIRGYVGAEPFVAPFQSTLADVTGDGVDANDALQIQRFWLKRRTSFPAGSWQTATRSVDLTAENATQVALWAAQTGDVRLDGSSTSKTTPLLATSSESAIAKSTAPAEPMSVASGATFEVPVRIGRRAALGAYGLALEYPAKLATFQGAGGPRNGLQAQAQDGTVRLAWFDRSGGEKPIEAKAGREIVTLTFRAAPDLEGKKTFDLAITEGELADSKGRPIEGVKLAVPKVTLGTPIPDEFALKGNYPNPFRSRTHLRFDLPSDAMVQVTVYNVLGQQVMQVERQMEAGRGRTFDLDASRLGSGPYFYRVKAEVDGETVKKTGRMVQVQ